MVSECLSSYVLWFGYGVHMCLTNTVVPIRHLSIYLLRASAPKNAMSKKNWSNPAAPARPNPSGRQTP